MLFLKTLMTRWVLWTGAVFLLIAATLYPSDMEGHYAKSRHGHQNALVVGVEQYGRHLNTVLPLATAIVLRDVKGLTQIGAISVVGMVATHGPKRLLDNVEVSGTRLGQRPNGGNHNMPSGHSALASAGAYFTVRRYSPGLGVIVWPVMVLTMHARCMLDAHTVSATIAGALIGIMVAALFAQPCIRFEHMIAGLWQRLRPQRASAAKSQLTKV